MATRGSSESLLFAAGSGRQIVSKAVSLLPRRLWQQLSLTAKFMLAASLVVSCGMSLLGAWVAWRVEQDVIKHAAAESAFYMANFIEPHAQGLAQSEDLAQAERKGLADLLERTPLARKVVSIKLWGRDGKLLYANNTEQIGRVYPITRRLADAWGGRIRAQLETLDDEEHEHERPFNVPLMEIYAPVFQTGTERIIAVAEFYENARELQNDATRAKRYSWLLVGSLALAMMLMLHRIVSDGSRTIENQKNTLIEQVERLSELLERNRALQHSLALARKRSAATNELLLRRVGTELHDGPAQLIGLGLLRLDSICPHADRCSHNASNTNLAVVRSALQDAMNEIRAISAGLVLPELEQLALGEVLNLVARQHDRRTHTKVTLINAEVAQDLQIPLAIKACIYRFAQEGLNNAFRHAGGKGQAIAVDRLHDQLIVEIRDAGPGFDPSGAPGNKGRLGLLGLRDRIETIGGQLSIISSDQGTVLRATFPLARTDDGNGETGA